MNTDFKKGDKVRFDVSIERLWGKEIVNEIGIITRRLDEFRIELKDSIESNRTIAHKNIKIFEVQLINSGRVIKGVPDSFLDKV